MPPPGGSHAERELSKRLKVAEREITRLRKLADVGNVQSSMDGLRHELDVARDENQRLKAEVAHLQKVQRRQERDLRGGGLDDELEEKIKQMHNDANAQRVQYRMVKALQTKATSDFRAEQAISAKLREKVEKLSAILKAKNVSEDWLAAEAQMRRELAEREAEVESLRKEVEVLKKSRASLAKRSKVNVGKENKELADARADLAATQALLKERDAELKKVKNSVSRNTALARLRATGQLTPRDGSSTNTTPRTTTPHAPAPAGAAGVAALARGGTSASRIPKPGHSAVESVPEEGEPEVQMAVPAPVLAPEAATGSAAPAPSAQPAAAAPEPLAAPLVTAPAPVAVEPAPVAAPALVAAAPAPAAVPVVAAAAALAVEPPMKPTEPASARGTPSPAKKEEIPEWRKPIVSPSPVKPGTSSTQAQAVAPAHTNEGPPPPLGGGFGRALPRDPSPSYKGGSEGPSPNSVVPPQPFSTKAAPGAPTVVAAHVSVAPAYVPVDYTKPPPSLSFLKKEEPKLVTSVLPPRPTSANNDSSIADAIERVEAQRRAQLAKSPRNFSAGSKATPSASPVFGQPAAASERRGSRGPSPVIISNGGQRKPAVQQAVMEEIYDDDSDFDLDEEVLD